MTIYKIGRAEDNDIVLGEKSVSRHHAELEELGAGKFRLKDVGSSSGTQMLSGSDWIDVKEAEVRHDTKIRFGEYETTPMDLVRDQDKTFVQARPSPAAAAPPAPPQPAAPKPAPPKPAAPKPAAPKPAAPKPAAPKPAAPRPAPSAAPRPAGAGGGMSPKTMWWIIGGAGGFVILAAIIVAVVLLTGGEGQRADVREPPPVTPPATPRTQPPPTTPPAQPPATPPAQPPRTPTPPAETGVPQRFTQSCRTTWQGSEAVCQCAARAVQPILQPGDYDGAISVMDLLFTNKGEEAKQRVQQIATQDQASAQRIVQAVQAIGRDCKNVQ